jgi:PKD domain/Matrixin
VRAGLAVLAAIAAVAWVAEPASAYRFAGERWPNKTISVGSRAPLYSSAVRTAIRAWNRARVGVRFTRAPAERARVIFSYSLGGGSGRYGCEGVAGGTGAGYPSPFVAMHVTVLRSCRSRALRRLTAVHELGHVLGLGHETRRCALMNPTGDVSTLLPSLCPRGTRLPARDDIRGARALYRREPAAVSDTIALFNPGPGSRIPMLPGPLQFSAAARNPGLDYRWSFGDRRSGAANRARGLDVQHRYKRSGVYTVTLRVFDGGTQIAMRRGDIELFYFRGLERDLASVAEEAAGRPVVRQGR